MKKKLEAELISIAHRILKLKNKSELVQLHLETQKLYEKLSVLRFLEEQFDEVRPTIGRAEIEAKLEMADIEKPIVAEIPSEPLRMTESEFVPVAVFMPEEVTEDRGPEDEEIEVAAVQTEPLRSMENEFMPISVFMPEEVTEDRGFEDEEITETTVQIQEEVPVASEPEIEEEESLEIEAPYVPEVFEEDATEEEEEEPATKPALEEDEVIIRHVLPMEEIEDEIDDEEEVEEETEETIIEEPIQEKPVQEEVKSAPKEISFADLLGHDFSEPVFERIDDIKSNTVETPVFEKSPVDFTAEPTISKEILEQIPHFKADVPKTEPVHNVHPKTITFGLNDKIGFEKHLFGGSSEEMNRVVSQLGSFNTFEEAKDFIEDMVKPDYNNWVGKEDYEQRFLEIIERRFV